MTAATPRQHLTLIIMLFVLGAFGLYYGHRKSIAPRFQTEVKKLTEDQSRRDFMKRDLANRQQPDTAAMRQAVLDAEGRLRGVKIEGSGTAGRFISTRPASELAAFLATISTEARRQGLDITRHSAVAPPDLRLRDLVIRELEATGSFTAVVRFIERLPHLTFRVLILKTQLDAPAGGESGPLRVLIRFAL
jgi:hypothetical protein